MNKEKIDRINQLAHKAKSEGLSQEEIRERDLLRKEYVEAIKANLRASCENIYIVDEAGRKTKLQKKH